MEAADLSLFAHVVGRSADDLDLAQAALMVAEAEYPGLDIARYIEMLDQLAARVQGEIAATPAAPPMLTVLRVLYEELGFQGNAGDYYDPKNSFLNDVLESRRGIPITLAIVLVEVSRRVGVDAQGISFPGHFLVRSAVSGGAVIIDPFDGRPLDAEDLQLLYARATNDEGPIDPSLLEPASTRQILLRMLNNLRGIYEGRGDTARLRAVLLRMALLTPSDEVRRLLDELEAAGQPGPAQLN
ncbi:MAG TPA: transglutaminase-like domain-containing protein [Polyangia bacterium]|nr:transglutaminase-like domain-containing protein [Polyangia bacterium]